jgi:hypothetical protein
MHGIYLAISPVQHVMQWKTRPVDGRGPYPYWKPKENNHGPEGGDDQNAHADALRTFQGGGFPRLGGGDQS